MGDRCYMSMSYFKKDTERVHDLLGEPEQCDEVPGPDGRVIVFGEFCEVNYGATSARDELAKAGVRFIGYHGEGGDYGAFKFCSDGVEMLEHECFNDGDEIALSMSTDDDAPTEASLIRAQAFAVKYRECEKPLTRVTVSESPS